MQEFPTIKFVELGNVLGARWRQLPPEDRKKYEALAEEDKARLKRELQEYNASKGTFPTEPGVAPLEMYMANMDQQMPFDPTAYQQHQAYDHSAYQYH